VLAALEDQAAAEVAELEPVSDVEDPLRMIDQRTSVGGR
jgi:hypothetical protein